MFNTVCHMFIHHTLLSGCELHINFNMLLIAVYICLQQVYGKSRHRVLILLQIRVYTISSCTHCLRIVNIIFCSVWFRSCVAKHWPGIHGLLWTSGIQHATWNPSHKRLLARNWKLDKSTCCNMFIIKSGHNLAYATTAQLSWESNNCDLFSSLSFK